MTGAAQSARGVANSRPVKVGARIGILAYGVTHLLIAGLALQVAFGGGSAEQADQTGAFQALAENPVGRVVLWVLVVGFVAVALWRLEQAIWGYGYEQDRMRNLRKRGISAFKAVLFAVLAVLAGRTAAGSGGGGGQQQGATAGVLGLPGGQFIVGAVGIGIAVAGVVKVVQGFRRKFEDDMSLPSDRRARQVAVRSGQIGFAAKGVALGLIGVLVVIAAVRFRPDQASGLDVALKTLAAQPFGPYLLVAMALGLAAYGVFCFFDARYHRV
jgi:fumarate reductase subunit D